MIFEDSVCVVTGASSGIGRAVAFSLASRGGRVCALGRDHDRLAALVEDLEMGQECEGRIVPFVVDFERDGEVESVAREILGLHEEKIDVVVHSAGAIARGSVEDACVDDLDRLYRVILRGPFVLTRALLPALRETGGQLVFINSLIPADSENDAVMYSAMKQASRAFADGLRQELNADGIRVVTVSPGRTDTPMQQWVHEYEERPYRPDLLLAPEDVVDVVVAALSADQRAEITDVSIRPIVKFGARRPH